MRNLTITGLSQTDIFNLVVGLERLRDDEAAEARRYREVAHTWDDPAWAHSLAQERDGQSVRAEELRQRVKETEGYF